MEFFEDVLSRSVITWMAALGTLQHYPLQGVCQAKVGRAEQDLNSIAAKNKLKKKKKKVVALKAFFIPNQDTKLRLG